MTEEKKAIRLANWATVVEKGNYCKPEEQSIGDIRLEGSETIVYEGNTLRYKGNLKFKIVTSSIRKVEWIEENGNKYPVFITSSGSRYILDGEPEHNFRKIVALESAEKLAEIIERKLILF